MSDIESRIDASLTEEDEPDIPPLLGGVPEGYYVPRTYTDPASARAARSRGYNVPARYREGDQYLIYHMNPEEVAALQDSLIRAGLLDPEDLPPGQRGFVGPASQDPTFAAYSHVLAFANQSGHTSVASALAAMAGGGFGQRPAETRGRLPAKVSNPEDLRRVFRAAVIDTLGEGWSNSQIDQMISAYQALETGFQTQMADAEDLAVEGVRVGGTLTAPPDPATFAAQQARQQDPTGAQANDFLGAANQFFSLIGQWNPPTGELPGV